MEKDYVSFEIAKLIKEKTDFNIPTEYRPLLPWFFCMYDENGEIHWGYYDKEWYPAVPYSIILRWLREKGICITAVYGDYPALNKIFWTPQIDSIEGFNLPDDFYKDYDEYEDAIEAALKYYLENLI